MKNRTALANTWFEVLVIIAILSVVLALPAFGYAFGEKHIYGGTDFNAEVAFAGAFAAFMWWLPIVAIFDVLRRKVES